MVLSGVEGAKYGNAVEPQLRVTRRSSKVLAIYLQTINKIIMILDTGLGYFNPCKANIEKLALVVIDQYNGTLLIICFPLYPLHKPFCFTMHLHYKKILKA